MPWLQLKIDSQREQVTPIEDKLLAVGALSVTLLDSADEPILEPGLGETPLWSNTQDVGLFNADVDTKAVDQALAASFGEAAIGRWEQLEDKDWSRAWMDDYHPIQCGQRLWICPSWTQPPNPDATNLMLDPGLAFGTGTHPTTFLCLQWLDAQNCQDQTVLDYGCGSGILGIAALLLGAQSACGVDIDPQALIATQENSLRNNLSKDAFPVYLPKQYPAAKHDIVVANILASPLVDLAEVIVEQVKPGGKICLSGVLSTQAEAVMAAYRPWVDFDSPAIEDQWARLTGVKRI